MSEENQLGNILLNKQNGESFVSQKEPKIIYDNMGMKLNVEQAYSNNEGR